MAHFNNKVVLITGGTTGIGFATAQRFHDAGAQVIISGRDLVRTQEAANAIGDGVLALEANVLKLADIESMMATIKAQFGKLDVVFVNAGITKPAPLTDVDETHFDEQMGINFKGAFFTIQKAADLMPDGGSIIVNTSIMDRFGTTGMSIYSASKAALRSISQSLSAELIGRGIRVNAVSPGPVETPLYSKMGLPQETLMAMSEQIVGNVPLGRFAKPEELAGTVLFLASEDASYIVGEEIIVDGGWVAT